MCYYAVANDSSGVRVKIINFFQIYICPLSGNIYGFMIKSCVFFLTFFFCIFHFKGSAENRSDLSRPPEEDPE